MNLIMMFTMCDDNKIKIYVVVATVTGNSIETLSGYRYKFRSTIN